MILVINSNDHPRLDEAYALRARILHDRLSWNVQVVAGKEIDELDDLPPVHMLYLKDGTLRGYLRLIPTTGPTMLTRYFADTFKEVLAAPAIWEASKFCLDVEKADLARHSAIMMAGLVTRHSAIMMAGLGQFCWRNGIETVTGIVGRKTLTAYNRGGIDVRVLEEGKLDGEDAFNIVYSMTKENLKSMTERFGDVILNEATLVHA